MAAVPLAAGRRGVTGGAAVELKPDTVLRALPEDLSSDLGGETVILHMSAGVYYGLDGVGSRIWQLIQTPRSVSEICARLLDEYDVDAGRCERAVLALLGEMSRAGLIETVDEPAA
jgi:hypothetical protein